MCRCETESAKFLEQNAKVMALQVLRRLIAINLSKDKLFVLETVYSLEYNRSAEVEPELCFMSNREMWMRHKTDFLQPASACRQWSGLSSESWDTDLWSRNFGTIIETHGAVSTVVVRSENHLLRDKLFVTGVNGNT
ncbi:hypothetical protein F2Q69_00048903 [Brassica cretica]|uniref:Uncharacterized protein n=1 Tax=Brassica cretica TaxID=69181 RepID=A0A8S9PST0_BRACR|nr:hypothetical protein F2Q69_00048903 [Brassica cretica]